MEVGDTIAKAIIKNQNDEKAQQRETIRAVVQRCESLPPNSFTKLTSVTESYLN